MDFAAFVAGAQIVRIRRSHGTVATKILGAFDAKVGRPALFAEPFRTVATHEKLVTIVEINTPAAKPDVADATFIHEAYNHSIATLTASIVTVVKTTEIHASTTATSSARRLVTCKALRHGFVILVAEPIAQAFDAEVHLTDIVNIKRANKPELIQPDRAAFIF